MAIRVSLCRRTTSIELPLIFDQFGRDANFLVRNDQETEFRSNGGYQRRESQKGELSRHSAIGRRQGGGIAADQDKCGLIFPL